MTRVLAVLAVVGAASAAQAGVVVLEDFNSSATFDPSGGGQFRWQVDGVDQLFNQRFFYRAGAMGDEAPVDALALTGAHVSDTNPFDDARNDTLALRYLDAAGGLQFRVNYTLRGTNPGSGQSDLAETIRITNVGQTATNVSFFQYVDFDLGGTVGGDIGRIVNGRIAQQVDTTGNFSVSETVVTPAPTAFEVGNFPSIVALFGNGAIDNLANVAGPIFGDVTWGFQWDFVLAPGQEFTISKDKLIGIPAPSALALIGLGGLVATRRRR
jgi:hypothetical protein